MGKRRKAQAPVAKVRPKPAKHFECPFCNSHASVDVKIDRVQGAGKAECGVCGQNFTAHTGMLDEAVDLYHAWLDACEDAIGKQVASPPPIPTPLPQRPSAAQQHAAIQKHAATHVPISERERQAKPMRISAVDLVQSSIPKAAAPHGTHSDAAQKKRLHAAGASGVDATAAGRVHGGDIEGGMARKRIRLKHSHGLRDENEDGDQDGEINKDDADEMHAAGTEVQVGSFVDHE